MTRQASRPIRPKCRVVRRLADASTAISVLGVALIAAAPSIDAARAAPKLLRPGPDRSPS
ncbi:MAG TPA: hypothetical protein VFY84_06280 [Jiangellales bacterium]|nr:hypothetical protein [Jiangellales bacterium]